MAVKLNGVAHTNGAEATWLADENIVLITVTYGMSVQEYEITVTNSEAKVQLSAMSVGSLTLDPVFNKSKYEYVTTTTDATNVIAATAVAGSTAVIKLNGVIHTSGQAATWVAGKNTVEISVTKGDLSKLYTIIVTKS